MPQHPNSVVISAERLAHEHAAIVLLHSSTGPLHYIPARFSDVLHEVDFTNNNPPLGSFNVPHLNELLFPEISIFVNLAM